MFIKIMILSILSLSSAYSSDIGCWYNEKDIGSISVYSLESLSARSGIKNETGEWAYGNYKGIMLSRRGDIGLENYAMTIVKNDQPAELIETSNPKKTWKKLDDLIREYSIKTLAGKVPRSSISISFNFLADNEESFDVIYKNPKYAIYNTDAKVQFSGGTVAVYNNEGNIIAKQTNCYLITQDDRLE